MQELSQCHRRVGMITPASRNADIEVQTAQLRNLGMDKGEEKQMEQRDFIGYGKNIPKVEWPGGARIAINVVLNYEIGAERNPLDGDEERETMGDRGPAIPLRDRNLGTESLYEYGSRAGVWRVLRLLEQYEVKGTIFASARALERNPEVAREFVARGHDIVGHGYRWIHHWNMAPDFERDQIRRAVGVTWELTGFRMKGWFCRYLRSLNTRRILMEEGFLFDSTDFSDDLPYYVQVEAKPFLIVPYAVDVNDGRFWEGSLLTGEHFYSYARDAFDTLYKEGSTHPKMMSVGIHERISGRPGPARGLERFLEYARSFPGVWFTRRTDLAEWWIQHCRPDR